MCRGLAEGGRRCAFHAGTAGRAAHNDRRKANRALKAEALKQAVAADLPHSLIARIKAAPPGEAKQLGYEYGLLSNPAGRAGDATPAAGVPPVKPAVAEGPRHRISQPGQDLPSALPLPADARHLASGKKETNPHPKAPSMLPDSASGLSDHVRKSISHLIGLQGNHAAERRLLDTEIKSVERIHGGVNDTRRVVLSDGTVAFFKSFDGLNDGCAHSYGQDDRLQPLHEASAWQLAKNLGRNFDGMVPTCVIREVEGKIGSLAMIAPGRQGAGWERIRDAEVDRGAFFDSLVGQQDRHRFNLFSGDGKVTLIDHGFTFAEPGDQLNHSILVSSRRKLPGRASLKKYEQSALKRLLASRDMHGLAGMLTEGRAVALRDRAQRMLDGNAILRPGEF
ncbi:hypothetical protein ABH924_003348 [Arthrobacter sp. GAS37]|uniref:hypothetical protein n=1 Tax=Arthrobacter sp. GAS37 TaxID=3156261 RepID=UPI003835431A